MTADTFAAALGQHHYGRVIARNLCSPENAARNAEREARILAYHLRPEEIAYRRERLEWIRRCAATTDHGPRYAIGAEMDGRQFSQAEVDGYAQELARLEALAAEAAQGVAA